MARPPLLRAFPALVLGIGRRVVLRLRRWARTAAGTVQRSAMICLAVAGSTGVPSVSQMT
jgi:hypothetical protein